MPTNRCTVCALNWPMKKLYEKCPKCEGATDPITNVASMDRAEAKNLRIHYEFDRFYEKWDAEQDPKRLKPDLADADSEVV